MTTTQDIITQAYVMCGDIGIGENESSAETQYALSILNEIFEEFSLNKVLAFATSRLVFPLVNNKQVYTMGVGGDFDVARPINIKEASILSLGVEYPVEIENLEQWQDISIKDISSGIPYAIYMDNAFPLNNLYIYPIPSDNLTSLILYTSTKFDSVDMDNITLDIVFPENYKKAIKNILAYELSIANKKPDDRIRMLADEAKALIRDNADTDIILNTCFDRQPFDYKRGY